MGGLNVKNTMVERVLQIVAPHPCSGCGKVGTVLCQDCKYDISFEPFCGCILCGLPHPYGICPRHSSPISRAFTVAQRGSTLEILINRLKFEHTKAAAGALAELLDDALPLLPDHIQLVPIPTVRSHIRERGYDQVALLACHFAERRGLSIQSTLVRTTDTTQHIVGRKERVAQAGAAFGLKSTQDLKGKTVLLLDDIVTTGATLLAAATLLKEAGATVWAATLAYQPLD